MCYSKMISSLLFLCPLENEDATVGSEQTNLPFVPFPSQEDDPYLEEEETDNEYYPLYRYLPQDRQKKRNGIAQSWENVYDIGICLVMCLTIVASIPGIVSIHLICMISNRLTWIDVCWMGDNSSHKRPSVNRERQEERVITNKKSEFIMSS